MINRNSYKSLIESVNQSTSQGLVKSADRIVESTTVSEGPDWDTHSRGSIKTKGNALRARATVASSSVAGPKNSVASKPEAAAISEEFDLVDQILMEGLEVFGEDDLEIILADFEETGELSEELIDLINEAASKQTAKPSREQSPITARPGYRPMRDRIRNPLNIPSFKPRQPEQLPPFYHDVDDDIPDNSENYPTGDTPRNPYVDRKSAKGSSKGAKGRPGPQSGAAGGAKSIAAKTSVDAASMG